jgi:hypothetical protein
LTDIHELVSPTGDDEIRRLLCSVRWDTIEAIQKSEHVLTSLAVLGHPRGAVQAIQDRLDRHRANMSTPNGDDVRGTDRCGTAAAELDSWNREHIVLSIAEHKQLLALSKRSRPNDQSVVDEAQGRRAQLTDEDPEVEADEPSEEDVAEGGTRQIRGDRPSRSIMGPVDSAPPGPLPATRRREALSRAQESARRPRGSFLSDVINERW